MSVFNESAETLATMLAACETFADACDGTASDFIHIGSDTSDAFPLGLISRTGDDQCKSVGTNALQYNGSLELRLEKEIPELLREDTEAALKEFGEWIDGIISDLMLLSGQPGYLLLRQITIRSGPAVYDDEEHKYICAAFLTVPWGME